MAKIPNIHIIQIIIMTVLIFLNVFTLVKYSNLKMQKIDVEIKATNQLLLEMDSENKLLEILKQSRNENNKLTKENKDLRNMVDDLDLRIKVMNEIRPPAFPH